MPSIRTRLLFAVVFYLSGASSHAQWEFQTYKVMESSREKLELKSAVEWKWEKSETSARIPMLTLRLEGEVIGRLNKVLTTNKVRFAKIEGKTLIVPLEGMSERVAVSSPEGNWVLEIDGVWKSDSPLVEDQCSERGVRLVAPKSNAPFYVGLSCAQKKDKPLELALTLPEEVDVANSTPTVKKRSGSTHYFQWQPSAKHTKIAFTAEHADKKYLFEIHQDLKPAKRAPKPQQKKEVPTGPEAQPPSPQGDNTYIASLAVGLVAMSIDGPDLAATDAKPLFSFRIPHYEMQSGFGLGIGVDFTFPKGSGADAMRFTFFEVAGTYEWVAAPGLIVRPKIGYYVISHAHWETQRSVNSNQLGLGLGVDYALGRGFSLQLDAVVLGWFSDEVNGHYSLELSVRRKVTDSFSLGLGGRIQALNGRDIRSGIARDHRLSSGFVSVYF